MEQMIVLELPCVNAKLKNSFKNDSHADVRIVYNDEAVFNLQKAYLRIESAYFKEQLGQLGRRQLEIRAGFQSEDFERVLSCFYGMRHQVALSEAVKYWSIAKFLKADVLAKKLRDSITSHLEQYDIFELLQLAHEYNEDAIFHRCLKHIEDSDYSLLKAPHFLTLPLELFTFVVKQHNRAKLKGSNALSNLQVHELIKGYCEGRPNQEEMYLKLKHELLNPQNLTSAEYKLIYHDDILQLSQMNPRAVKTSHSFGSIPDSPFMKNQSLSQTANEFVISSENTLYKKRIAELNDENEMFKKEVSQIKSQVAQSAAAKLEFEKAMEEVRNAEKKRMEAVKGLEGRLQKMEGEMAKKDEVLKKQDKIIAELKAQLEGMKTKQNQSLMFSVSKAKEEDIMVTSKILPGDCFKDIFKPPTKQPTDQNKQSTKLNTPVRSRSTSKDQPAKGPSVKKSPSHQPSVLSSQKKPPEPKIQTFQEQLPQEIQGHDRLQFSIEPQAITKQQYSNLIQILQIDSFKKVRLEFVFRAKKNCNNLSQFLKSAKGCENLLFLIHIWEWEKTVGAFISVPVGKEGLVSDPNSFIFSVTQCRKFNSVKPKCIEIGNGSLVKFSGDLVICNNCLEEQSECNWPTGFEADASIRKDPTMWLTGGRQFQITELEVYEIREDDLEMKL